MVLTIYTDEFRYRELPKIGMCPAMAVTLKHKEQIDTIACIDTGAEHSLFSGDFAENIGLKISEGKAKTFSSLTGALLDTWGHDVNIIVNQHLISDTIYFPEKNLSRNLLGRSFLSNLQIGFRENHNEFYILFDR